MSSAQEHRRGNSGAKSPEVQHSSKNSQPGTSQHAVGGKKHREVYFDSRTAGVINLN